MAAPPKRLGRYDLLRKIGSGGMGEVWEAVLHGPAGFRKRVAVKRLRGPGRGDRELAREARLGALLSHPNVVSTWELSETDEGWLVAMELVRGPSLTDLRELGPLPAGVVVDVGVQVAAGLAHIHELTLEGRSLRIVHRDVKPRNLLVDPSGLVKLADLGIAALAGSETSCVGTPGFVAPEQIDGAAEPRSDLFSLGAVLAWLVTGIYPFGRGPQSLVAVRRPDQGLRRARILEAIEADVPGLGPIVARCLQVDPEARWPSARALADALRGLYARCPAGPSLAEIVAERFHAVEAAPEGALAEPLTEGTTVRDAPSEALPMIGREAELDALRTALGRQRVVALRGPAGIGKSRLAAELVRSLPQARAIDLEEARTMAGLCTAIGSALSVPLIRGEPQDQLGAALAGRGGLVLVLDGADEVLEPCADALRQWTVQAPELRAVIVSRRRSGAGAEIVLPPLSAQDTEALLRARSGEALRSAAPHRIAELIEQLDGLPLAIELAAARARSVPIEHLIDELASPADDDSPLRAAFDAAWAGLDEAGQAALAQLSVFAGGWEPEAAESVLALPGDLPASDVVRELLHRSLVHSDRSTGRCRLLAQIRALAEQQLGPSERARAEQRHCDCYVRLFALVDPLRDSPDHGDDLVILSRERENLLAATRRAIARGDGAAAGSTALVVLASVLRGGPLRTGLALIEEVLPLAVPPLGGIPIPDTLLAKLRATAGSIANALGDRAAATEHLARALDAARRSGSLAAEAMVELSLGNEHNEHGDVTGARAWLTHAAEVAASLGHRRLLARATTDLAIVHRRAGDLDEAERCLRRGIALHRQVGNRHAEGTALNNLANLRVQRGAVREGRALYFEALALAEAVSDHVLTAILYANLAMDEGREGRLRSAVSYMQRTLGLQRQLGSVGRILTLGNLGWSLLQLGELDEARRVLEESLTLSERYDLPALGTVAMANLGYLAMLEGRFDEADQLAQRALRAEEAAGDLRSAMMMHLLLATFARGRADEGDLERSVAETETVLGWTETHDDVSLRGEARLERCLALFLLGDLERAEADLSLAEPDLSVLDTIRARAARVGIEWERRQIDRAEAEHALDALAAEGRLLDLREEAPLMRWIAEVRARIG